MILLVYFIICPLRAFLETYLQKGDSCHLKNLMSYLAGCFDGAESLFLVAGVCGVGTPRWLLL